MAGERIQRRLAAILAADVAGYSRMMGRDEVGTLQRLKALRAEFWDPSAAAHGGRIVKTTGDGTLIEFPSAVDALAHAVEIQRGMAERNADIAEDERIELRIGINVGDIIIDADDIFGDGVNVAARLEAATDPGGVSISASVYEHVRGKVDIAFEDQGPRPMKNIAEPVRVYRVQLETGAPGVAPTAAASAAPAIPDKPSIAVLPFTSISSDPDQAYFADGMTEDLITDLSKISGLFVVARNSTFSYKDRQVDVRTVARDLGVLYVLEGSVRKAGERVRINAQLIDATTGGHLWAERYDGALADVFELQDEVGAKVVSALSVQLTKTEQAKLERVHTHNLDAYELFVRARATPYPPIPAKIEQARRMFEQVMEMDPSFAGGYAGLSLIISFGLLWMHEQPDGVIDRALGLANKAVEIDPAFSWSYTALSLARLHRHEHDAAVEAARIAVDLQPSDSDAHAFLGLVLGMAGRPEEGMSHIEMALRLNPQFIDGPYLNLLGQMNNLAGNYQGAIDAFERNMGRGGPHGPPAYSWAAAAYAMLGRMDDAAAFTARVLAQIPDFHLETWNFTRLIRDPEMRERFVDSAAKAGLPQ